MRRQSDHGKRFKDILSTEKKDSLLPHKIKPARCSETLHCIRTGFFQTIVFFDKIFSDVTPILAGLTEREANCFGRFCCMSLNLILKWHSSKSVFVNECEGFPAVSHESASRTARSLHNVRLAKSLGFVLSTSNYVLIRNGLTLMTKILPTSQSSANL
uniref:THO complex subunitTHOC2 C-terminal domain-containing protein n=1 Tax=Ditylenchus dipsaci TaxID=166011 RepID=A0A915DYF2_9BILA